MGDVGGSALRLAAALASSAALVLLSAAPALAHSTLVASEPAAGANVDVSPADVRLTFDEALSPGVGAVTVTGPDGVRRQHGPALVDGGSVTQALDRLAVPGRYRVSYRLVSADDGHPVVGALHFDLAVPGAGTSIVVATATVTAAEPNPGAAVGPGLALGAVGLLLAASGWLARRRATDP